MKLLVIEDSERLRRSIGQGLATEGHTVDLAADGLEGLGYAESYRYDVILLDLMLPKLDGFEVLNRLRDQGSDTHILILSAKDEIESRVRGLDLGADDYLIKPFAFDELVARIRALGRRKQHRKHPIIQVGAVQLDTVLRRAVAKGVAVPLTAKEYELFEFLATHPGRVFSQRDLIDHLHESSIEICSNVVEVLVYSIKQKFNKCNIPPIIRNKRNQGYYVD